MSTTVEALEGIGHSPGCASVYDEEYDCNCQRARAEAAIPLAELEGQAMKLLEKHAAFAGLHFPLGDYIQWKNDRDALLRRVEALK